ncbi:AGE family epimerase/isomerase, partial [Citrobacter youngae]|uniref:AGE family epimerase/isomerase n=1 Tax=Citrobacter youngae TaxID=133448 RepID=UPI0019532925
HHARLSGDDGALVIADRLFDFGRAHGLADQPACAAFDEVDRSGAVIKPTKLLWPQTELLKALAARLEFGRDDGRGPRIDQVLALIFRHYV